MRSFAWGTGEGIGPLSRGPRPFCLNMRTLDGPPSWNRSTKWDGEGVKGKRKPVRADIDTLWHTHSFCVSGSEKKEEEGTYEAVDDGSGELRCCFCFKMGYIATEACKLLQLE